MKQDHLMSLAEDLLIDQQEVDNFIIPDDSVNIRLAEDYEADLIKKLNTKPEDEGCYLPWAETHSKVLIRPGELSIWGGFNGHKKSIMTSHCALDFVHQNQTVCIASFEMHPVITLKRMASQAIGNQTPTDEAISGFFKSLKGRLYLYDQQNTVPVERVKRMAGLCGNKLRLDHLFIDSLMKCGLSPDDYGGQKEFINELHAIAKDTGMHIHLVAHMRKPPKDLRYVPDRYDISGGSDITNQADNVFIVWTDMEKKAEGKSLSTSRIRTL